MDASGIPAPFDDYLPTVSGGRGSPLDRGSLDFEGRRFLGTASTGLARDAVRVFAGAAHGGAQERARLAADELERLGAGERAWLVVGAPTGRGWVDHVLVCALEELADGDVATVASQFGIARSIASTRLVAPARESLAALLHEVARRPSLRRPRLVVAGESFGAWTIAGLLDDLAALAPEAVGLVALPGVANVTGDDARLRRLRDAGTRVVRHERADDPVVAFPGASLAWRPSRAWGSADGRRWWPVVSARRALRAIDQATRTAEPWRLRTSAHDYRHELAAVAARLLDLPVDEHVASVQRALDRAEVESSSWRVAFGPAPLASWPGPDA